MPRSRRSRDEQAPGPTPPPPPPSIDPMHDDPSSLGTPVDEIGSGPASAWVTQSDTPTAALFPPGPHSATEPPAATGGVTDATSAWAPTFDATESDPADKLLAPPGATWQPTPPAAEHHDSDADVAAPAAPTPAPLAAPAPAPEPQRTDPVGLTDALSSLDEVFDVAPDTADAVTHVVDAAAPPAVADSGWAPPVVEEAAAPGDTSSHDDVLADDGADDDGDLDDLFGADTGAAPHVATDPAPGADPAPRAARVQSFYEPPVQLRMDYERAGQLIESITQMIGSRPDVARRVSQFQLTRDSAVEARQFAELTSIISHDLSDVPLPITSDDVGELTQLVYDELVGLGPLGIPWRDPDVDEILIDAWDKINVDVRGRLRRTHYRFRTPEHAEQVARDLAERVSGRSLSRSHPVVTAELPDARIHFVYKPVAKSGLYIALRKFGDMFGMDDLLRSGSLSADMSAFLFDAVRGRAAVLVSGGTSVGKTTLLNALSEAIGDHERVVTIEDSYELRLSAPFVISMQTKEAGNSDDLVTIDQEFLVRSSLRMRPDRVIVGEIRDPAAAEVMLQAAMSGHEGTMTTIHADNVEQALNWRLTNLVRRGDVSTPLDVVRWQISEAFDLAVQGTRSREGRRYISEISEVVGELRDGMIVHNPLFRGHCEFGEAPVFERVGSLTPDGRLVQRITDAGIDPARWLAD